MLTMIIVQYVDIPHLILASAGGIDISLVVVDLSHTHTQRKAKQTLTIQ